MQLNTTLKVFETLETMVHEGTIKSFYVGLEPDGYTIKVNLACFYFVEAIHFSDLEKCLEYVCEQLAEHAELHEADTDPNITS